MKLGFVSAILPDLDLDQTLQVAAEQGFDCVELMCWPKGKAERKFAGVTHVDAAALDDAAAARIREKAAETGVEIAALGFYPNPLSDDRAYAQSCIDHIERVMDAAKRLGVRRVNTFAGAEPTKSLDANFERFAEVWPGLVAKAEKRDILLGIENCPMYFTQDEWPGGKNLATSPRNWRRMFEIVPSPHFGLNYDPSHFIWQGMDYLKPLRAFKDRLFHVHAKDARVDQERLDDVGVMATPLEYHRPVLPGMGAVDWGAFVSVLGEIGYRAAVCIEVEDDAYADSLEDRKRALSIARKVLEPYFG